MVTNVFIAQVKFSKIVQKMFEISFKNLYLLMMVRVKPLLEAQNAGQDKITSCHAQCALHTQKIYKNLFSFI